MKSKKLLFGALPVTVFVLAACGGGGGGGGGGGATPPPQDTSITTTDQGSKAASSSTSGTGLAANGTTALSNLASSTAGAPVFKAPRSVLNQNPRFAQLNATQAKAMQGPKALLASALKRAKAAATGTRTVQPISYSGPCATSGNVALSGSFDDFTLDYTLSVVYTDCREFDVSWNGGMAMTGTDNTAVDASNNVTGTMSFSSTFGNGDAVLDLSDLVATIYPDSVSPTATAHLTVGMSMSGSFDFTGGAYTYAGNGGMDYHDVLTDSTYTVTMTNLSTSGTAAPTAADPALWAGSYTTNGSVSEAWTGASSGGVVFTFTNLAMTWEQTSLTTDRWSINGTISSDFTPDSCFEGTFSFVTVTPVVEDWTTGQTTAGQIVINGNTIVTFNADGTITVQVTDQPAVTYTEAELAALCPVEDMSAL